VGKKSAPFVLQGVFILYVSFKSLSGIVGVVTKCNSLTAKHSLMGGYQRYVAQKQTKLCSPNRKI